MRELNPIILELTIVEPLLKGSLTLLCGKFYLMDVGDDALAVEKSRSKKSRLVNRLPARNAL